jgi:hypothetical protein
MTIDIQLGVRIIGVIELDATGFWWATSFIRPQSGGPFKSALDASAFILGHGRRTE